MSWNAAREDWHLNWSEEMWQRLFGIATPPMKKVRSWKTYFACNIERKEKQTATAALSCGRSANNKQHPVCSRKWNWTNVHRNPPKIGNSSSLPGVRSQWTRTSQNDAHAPQWNHRNIRRAYKKPGFHLKDFWEIYIPWIAQTPTPSYTTPCLCLCRMVCWVLVICRNTTTWRTQNFMYGWYGLHGWLSTDTVNPSLMGTVARYMLREVWASQVLTMGSATSKLSWVGRKIQEASVVWTVVVQLAAGADDDRSKVADKVVASKTNNGATSNG